jgi:hypothetical protein
VVDASDEAVRSLRFDNGVVVWERVDGSDVRLRYFDGVLPQPLELDRNEPFSALQLDGPNVVWVRGSDSRAELRFSDGTLPPRTLDDAGPFSDIQLATTPC